MSKLTETGTTESKVEIPTTEKPIVKTAVKSPAKADTSKVPKAVEAAPEVKAEAPEVKTEAPEVKTEPILAEPSTANKLELGQFIMLTHPLRVYATSVAAKPLGTIIGGVRIIDDVICQGRVRIHTSAYVCGTNCWLNVDELKAMCS